MTPTFGVTRDPNFWGHAIRVQDLGSPLTPNVGATESDFFLRFSASKTLQKWLLPEVIPRIEGCLLGPRLACTHRGGKSGGRGDPQMATPKPGVTGLKSGPAPDFGSATRHQPTLRCQRLPVVAFLLQEARGIHHFSKHAFMVTLTFPIVSFGYFVADLWLL